MQPPAPRPPQPTSIAPPVIQRPAESIRREYHVKLPDIEIPHSDPPLRRIFPQQLDYNRRQVSDAYSEPVSPRSRGHTHAAISEQLRYNRDNVWEYSDSRPSARYSQPPQKNRHSHQIRPDYDAQVSRKRSDSWQDGHRSDPY
eukprot:999926_1